MIFCHRILRVSVVLVFFSGCMSTIREKSIAFSGSDVDIVVPSSFHGPHRVYLALETPNPDPVNTSYQPEILTVRFVVNGMESTSIIDCSTQYWIDADGDGGIVLGHFEANLGEDKRGIRVLFVDEEISALRDRYGRTSIVLSSGPTL